MSVLSPILTRCASRRVPLQMRIGRQPHKCGKHVATSENESTSRSHIIDCDTTGRASDRREAKAPGYHLLYSVTLSPPFHERQPLLHTIKHHQRQNDQCMWLLTGSERLFVAAVAAPSIALLASGSFFLTSIAHADPVVGFAPDSFTRSSIGVCIASVGLILAMCIGRDRL